MPRMDAVVFSSTICGLPRSLKNPLSRVERSCNCLEALRSASISRLRYEFRCLGRTAASALLNGISAPILKPALVSATAVL